MLNLLWLIPLAPFVGFLLNGLFGKRAGKPFVTAVAILGSLAPAVLGTWAAIQYHAAWPHGDRYVNHVYNWIASCTTTTAIGVTSLTSISSCPRCSSSSSAAAIY